MQMAIGRIFEIDEHTEGWMDLLWFTVCMWCWVINPLKDYVILEQSSCKRFTVQDKTSISVRMAQSLTPLQRLKFNNIALKTLPLDSSLEPGSRTVTGACFSRVEPQPLLKPTIVALSEPALALLGLNADEVLRDPHAAEYLSGSRVIPGSEPAAHCYCGHQFGQFAGQLGDGAVCYLGEVETGAEQTSDPTSTNPCGRWEIQVKGAGRTPYSRYRYSGFIALSYSPY